MKKPPKPFSLNDFDPTILPALEKKFLKFVNGYVKKFKNEKDQRTAELACHAAKRFMLGKDK